MAYANVMSPDCKTVSFYIIIQQWILKPSKV